MVSSTRSSAARKDADVRTIVDGKTVVQGPVFTQELSDELATFIQKQRAFADEQTKTRAKHSEILNALQSRVATLELGAKGSESKVDDHDFDADDFGSDVDADDILGSQANRDPKYDSLRANMEESATKLAVLTARVGRIEDGRVQRKPDVPFVEDQLERANTKIADLSNRVACAESEVVIMKMALSMDKTDGKNTCGTSETQEINAMGWNIKETFIPRGISSDSQNIGNVAEPLVVSAAFFSALT